MHSQTVAGEGPANHLIGEKSPYLQQHAHNPVDWYPWSAEAFRRAESEDKPVFLSIGYATCHWCHVMAHESFEDQEIASILNTGFVAVKVDREERPDIDSVYMAACQQMSGQGGWPLTIIMTPDKKPFFAGTYFPRSSRAGMPGLSEILEKVTRLWKDDRTSLAMAGEQITTLLAGTMEGTSGTAGLSLLTDGYNELAASFDSLHGGFGSAPKFPVPSRILFLLRYWKRTGSARALRMAEETLEAMRCGGIYDHCGGGFHRYSTDTAWRVPHFEKMLYDQALLLMAFTEAWLATKKPLYRKTAEEIITYVTRDLVSPEGAFISAEDADSPGGEGAYYLWTRDELDAVLGETDGAFAAALFHVKVGGNFPDREGSGRNILFLRPGDDPNTADMPRISSVQKRLFETRQHRARPLKDKKVLTDWNGLMIAALAQAARAFDRPEHYRTAATAMRFLLTWLKTPDGGLLHRYCDGEAAISAFCDDYAFVIHALIGLYEAGFETAWLEEALRLTGYCNRHFADPKGSGYYSTSDEGEVLITRKKEVYDGALPSGNSVMLVNLVLLGHLTGNPAHEEQASRLADAFAGTVAGNPSAYTAYLCGLDHLLGPSTDVVIAGETADPEAAGMIRVVRDMYLPHGTLHVITRQSAPALRALAPFTEHMSVPGGNVAAYVCTGNSCSPPVATAGALQEMLKKAG